MTLIPAEEIPTFLDKLPGWTHEGHEIVKVYELQSFPGAISFVTWVGFLAEKADHHPDIDIRWRKVRVKLSTHSEGGITDKDLDLALKIDGIAGTA